MRLRAIGVHAELLAGENVGSAHTTADGRSARRKKTGLAPMRSSRAEIHHLAPFRGRDNARGFAGDHGLVAERRREDTFP